MDPLLGSHHAATIGRAGARTSHPRLAPVLLTGKAADLAQQFPDQDSNGVTDGRIADADTRPFCGAAHMGFNLRGDFPARLAARRLRREQDRQLGGDDGTHRRIATGFLGAGLWTTGSGWAANRNNRRRAGSTAEATPAAIPFPKSHRSRHAYSRSTLGACDLGLGCEQAP